MSQAKDGDDTSALLQRWMVLAFRQKALLKEESR
jgi:hypothetical protein